VCTYFADNKQVPGSLLSTLRGLEQEADSMAVRYLRAAGYDPLAMLEFFNKLRYEQPRLAQTLSSDDLLALRTYVEKNLPPNPEYIVTTTAFGRIRNRFTVQPKRPALTDAPSLRKVPDPPPSRATTLR
jgi:predicted Zn-dependent protease